MRFQRGNAARTRIVLSLAASADLLVPVVVYRRHPDTRPVHTQVTAALILALLIAAVVWAVLWGTARRIRRSPSGGVRTWIALTLALALRVVIALALSLRGRNRPTQRFI
jgi:hypothetical protein